MNDTELEIDDAAACGVRGLTVGAVGVVDCRRQKRRMVERRGRAALVEGRPGRSTVGRWQVACSRRFGGRCIRDRTGVERGLEEEDDTEPLDGYQTST